MKKFTPIMIGMLSSSALFFSYGSYAKESLNFDLCASEVLLIIHEEPYKGLSKTLKPQVGLLSEDVVALETNRNDPIAGAAAYLKLFNDAQAIVTAHATPGARMVVTEPDGTVILDTSKGFDATFCTMANTLVGNSLDCFKQKLMNENHNSRIAIHDAQAYPCGIGLETKFSSTVLTRQSYVARRLSGGYLQNLGTARISEDAIIAR